MNPVKEIKVWEVLTSHGLSSSGTVPPSRRRSGLRHAPPVIRREQRAVEKCLCAPVSAGRVSLTPQSCERREREVLRAVCVCNTRPDRAHWPHAACRGRRTATLHTWRPLWRIKVYFYWLTTLQSCNHTLFMLKLKISSFSVLLSSSSLSSASLRNTWRHQQFINKYHRRTCCDLFNSYSFTNHK